MKRLKYDEFQRAVTNLVLIVNEIYDITYNKLMKLELEGFKDKQAFDKAIENLEILKLKEKRILDYIYGSVCTYDIDNEINNCTQGLIDDPVMRTLVYTRLENDTLDYNTQYFDDLDDDYYEDEKEFFEEENDLYIETKVFYYLNLEYLRYSQNPKDEEILKGKYNFSFTNRKVESDLIVAGFNPENLLIPSNETIAKSLNITEEAYQTYVNEVALDSIQSQLDNIVLTEGDDSKNTLNLIEFFITKLVPEDIRIVKDMCLYEMPNLMDSIAEELFEKIIAIANTHIKGVPRENEEDDEEIEELEENEDTASFTEKYIDVIIELIKTENRIYNTMHKMYLLELNNKKNTSIYKTLVQKLDVHTKLEEHLISHLAMIDPEIKNTINGLVDKYLNILSDDNEIKEFENLFQENEEKSKIIKKRLLGLLLDEKEPLNASLYIDSSFPIIIENEQRLEAMKQYEEYTENQTNKDVLLKVKYKETFENPFLLKEFINGNGSFKGNNWYQDSQLCDLLGITKQEYDYDKKNLLFELAEVIITYLYGTANQEEITEEEAARAKMKMIFLESITQNLDEETIERIEEDSQYTEENYKFKNELSRIFRKSKIKVKAKQKQTTNKN